MSKKLVLTYLYFTIFFFDALGVFVPEIISRQYTTFFPLPILLLLYLYSIKKVNWLFVISLFCTFFGVIFFNIESFFKLGIVFYAAGVLFYVMISLKQASVISTKSVIIATLPFLVLYLAPLLLFSDAVRGDIFNYIILYSFFVGFFFLISSLIYVNQQTRSNLWLLFSGSLFLFSTVIHGYNMFFGEILILQFGVVVTFLLMHYAMYRYTIAQEIHA
ncbi:MAG: lysoplasmalogenase family protein [Bacteroidota bacterium]